MIDKNDSNLKTIAFAELFIIKLYSFVATTTNVLVEFGFDFVANNFYCYRRGTLLKRFYGGEKFLHFFSTFHAVASLQSACQHMTSHHITHWNGWCTPIAWMFVRDVIINVVNMFQKCYKPFCKHFTSAFNWIWSVGTNIDCNSCDQRFSFFQKNWSNNCEILIPTCKQSSKSSADCTTTTQEVVHHFILCVSKKIEQCALISVKHDTCHGVVTRVCFKK